MPQILDDGWILRFGKEYTKQANSITSLYSSAEELTQKSEHCEAIYRSFNLRPIFRLNNGSRLETLNRTLDELDYEKQYKISVLMK